MEDNLYSLALRFLSYRTRSEKEVREKLRALMKRHSGSSTVLSSLSKDLSRIDSGVANAPQNDNIGITEKIIAKLKEQKFINDEEFARMFLENRNRFKPRSLRLIKLELKQKGIDPETIEKMVNDEGLRINDLESAKRLAEKKIGRFRSLPKQEIYQKLGRYLASKGFSWDTIKKAIDPVKS